MPSPNTSLFWQPKHREKTWKGHGEAGLGNGTVRSTLVSIPNEWESVPEHCKVPFSQLASYAPRYQSIAESIQRTSCPQRLPNDTASPAVTSSKERAN